MWMHNGNVGAWRRIKRRLVDSIAEKWFLSVQGGTDSEWAFALFLDSMERLGHNPDDQTKLLEGFGHIALRQAMLKTIQRINALIAAIPDMTHGGGKESDTRSLLNFAVTDGHSVVCSRYVSSRTDEAASLFFSSGTTFREHAGQGNFRMERLDKGADIVLVASEPLTWERNNWVPVPTNSVLTIHKQTVLIHPIVDEYYNADPAFERSKGFARSKGLISGAPGASANASLAATPAAEVVDPLRGKVR